MAEFEIDTRRMHYTGSALVRGEKFQLVSSGSPIEQVKM